MDTPLTHLRAALAGRYEVEHELGRGGMAVVYLGKDLRLGRRVAIKVFEHQGGDAAGGERFLREIRVAAQLQHPNILPVHDSGDADGLLYYIMPYVTGATLRERLEREGPLPIADAVRIAREVAEALDHAHREGIVHRDIKPDNIMLASGVAVVADFGIARAIEQAGAGNLTDAGMAIGTPNYMSPEQATASPNVDGRADIYALGCVLYEMLAGTPPFNGPTAQAVMARHTADQVPPISTVRPIAPALEAAVIKALAKLPVDRWPTGHAFAQALTAEDRAPGVSRAPRSARMRIAIVTAAIAALAAATWFGWSGFGAGRAGDSMDSVRTVAVLPFRYIGDSAQAYVADGLTEAVYSGLVRAEGLHLTSSSRAAAFGDSLMDLRAVARALGADAMVTATVQQSGTTLRVIAHLVNAADGRDVWTEHYNGNVSDVFSFQDSITVQLVSALRPHLTPAHRAAVTRGVRTRDPTAWRQYQQAVRLASQLSETSVGRARLLLDSAIARDSAFSDAWAMLSTVLDYEARFSTASPEAYNAAIRVATNRAIELDSTNGLAFGQRAWIRSLQDWDWDGATRDMRRAVALAPGLPDLGAPFMYVWNNQPDSALALARRVLDTASSFSWETLGTSFAATGRYDSAVIAWERAQSLDTTYNVHSVLALGYLRLGRRADGDRAQERHLAISGNDAQGIGWGAAYYGRAGDQAGVGRMEQRLARVARERSWGVHSATAMVRLARNDRAGAIDALEAAVRAREYLLPAAMAHVSDSLRGDPRFERLARVVMGTRIPHTIF